MKRGIELNKSPSKRQREFIAVSDPLGGAIPATIKTSHLICTNARAHAGKQVQTCLTAHRRFVMHCTPVHYSWLNQVEQWCSVLQPKRLRIVDFAPTVDIPAKLAQCLTDWNELAHRFMWTTRSVAKVMGDAGATAA